MTQKLENAKAVIDNMLNNMPVYEGTPLIFWIKNKQSIDEYKKLTYRTLKTKLLIKRLKRLK